MSDAQLFDTANAERIVELERHLAYARDVAAGHVALTQYQALELDRRAIILGRANDLATEWRRSGSPELIKLGELLRDALTGAVPGATWKPSADEAPRTFPLLDVAEAAVEAYSSYVNADRAQLPGDEMEALREQVVAYRAAL